MSKPKLSMMDHRKAEDVQYLVQPRGPGKSWVFRMATPPALMGLPNPWDGKQLGKEIKRGLATCHLPDARKRRDILLGDLRRLEAQHGDKGAFSLSSAFEWREAIAAGAAADPDDTHGRLEMVLQDRLEAAAARGFPVDQLRRFSRVATGKGYPLERALAEYIEARRPGNPSQFKPISQSTVDNLKTAAKHLRAFLRDTDNTVCLEDMTPEVSRRFRVEYLPRLTGPRNPHGMAAKTVEKNITLLAGVWIWAGDVGKTPKRYGNPWVFQSGIKRTAKAAQSREDFKPQEAAKLLAASLRGTRQGDLLRLAFATGCRIDEIATLKTNQVRVDGSGFHIAHGKNANALRFVPVVADAQTLLAARVAAHGASGRLFPDWPIKPGSGKAAAVSQWFTRFRRSTLGADTDGRLALHSTRHTWRTAARRAGIGEADINDLGGWEGQRTSNSVYDHGLLEEQLVAAQRRVWEQLRVSGYLEGF